MKYLFFIALIIPSIAMVNIDDPYQDKQKISAAISNGDAEALANYFDEDIEIAILDEEDIYDKAEAKTVVSRFFTKYKPQKYSSVHQGVSEGKASEYTIGNLQAGNATFRVYLYMKVKNGKYLIQELRFDKE